MVRIESIMGVHARGLRQPTAVSSLSRPLLPAASSYRSPVGHGAVSADTPVLCYMLTAERFEHREPTIPFFTSAFSTTWITVCLAPRGHEPNDSSARKMSNTQNISLHHRPPRSCPEIYQKGTKQWRRIDAHNKLQCKILVHG